MKKILFSIGVVIAFAFSCSTANTPEEKPKENSFAKGGDVGWLPQMEATGYKFYDTDGTQKTVCNY